MSFLILGLIFKDNFKLDNEDCISTSYPDFKLHLNKMLIKDA